MSEKYYNYNDLQQMQEKAKRIDYESDKKSFLRTMNTLEQKMALFYSRRPYDIIIYLDSLNYKETNKMLNELTNGEISKLLEQFTAEDKRNFYSNFSNSVLVNKFIANDRQAFSHVDELNLERKIELLDSSKVSTQKATKEIYDTLSEKEKEVVEDKITSPEGSLVVDNVIEASENTSEKPIVEVEEIKSNEQEIQKEEVQEEIEEKEEEKQNQEQEIQKEEVEEEKFNKINDFLKLKLEQYKQQNPKFKDIDINNPKLFNSLSDELKQIVTNDFNLLTEEQKEKLNNNEEEQKELLNEFQKSKEDCETELINNVKQNKMEEQQEVINEKSSYVKTL